MRKVLLALSMLMLTAGAFAQSGAQERVVSFRFVPGDDMFYIPWEGNDAQLNALYVLVDEYRSEITSGKMPIYVDSYSSSMKDPKESLRLAFVRANRVKSELILHKGLTEDNFITKNYTTTYTGTDGVTHRDVVVVMLRLPDEDDVEYRYEFSMSIQPGKTPEPEPEPEPQPERAETAPRSEIVDVTQVKPYCFAVRTNLLYDAFLLPTLGVEWRVNPNLGLKLDGAWSDWGDSHGKVQKIWMLSPEVRWYLTPRKQFYVGVGGNYAEINVYKYMLGGLLSGKTGYQGSLWSAGAVVGYQLALSRSFAIDFNLGLGYTKFEYDSFNMVGDTRVSKAKNQTKNLWGPTQAGVSLVWKLSGNK